KTEEVVTGLKKINDFMVCLSLFKEASRYKFGFGSTATVILIADSQILAANVKESSLSYALRRSSLLARLKHQMGYPIFLAKELTMDHDRVGKRSRVESSGGQVSEWGGVSQVNGHLAISRAIGDLLF
nr:probable protein phosphatase 2C 51 [Tanacetum cinerariifolium]